MYTLEIINKILYESRKVTTYKLGILLGITDYIIENSNEKTNNNLLFIPTFYLAKKFLAYYTPLVLEGIIQGQKSMDKSPTEIENYIISFVELNNKQKILPFSLTSKKTNELIKYIEEKNNIPQELIELLFNIRSKIIDQPLQHIRNIGDEEITFFSLQSAESILKEGYESNRNKGIKLKLEKDKPSMNWKRLLLIENLYLVITNQTFKEIHNYKFLIRDAIIKKWCQESLTRFKTNFNSLIELFDLWKK